MARIQHSFGTEQEWATSNPTIRLGELFIVTRTDGSFILKVGTKLAGQPASECDTVWDNKQAAADAAAAVAAAAQAVTKAQEAAEANTAAQEAAANLSCLKMVNNQLCWHSVANEEVAE